MKSFTILAACLITGAANAQKMQEKEVPATIKSAFQKAHPNAKDVKWEKEGANYEAEFEQDKTERSVLLNAEGSILETEVEIAVADLPQQARDYVAAHYKGQNVKEAAKITDAKGVVTYEAEIKGRDLIFDAKGTFIKETK